jgi:hypothetical protein
VTPGAEAPSSRIELYDPKRLIRGLVELDEPPPATARDCLVLWLISLEDRVDPAEAASYLLGTVLGTPHEGIGAELARELGEVARFPRERLAARPKRRRPRRTD